MIIMMLMFLQRKKRTWVGGSVWPLEIIGDFCQFDWHWQTPCLQRVEDRNEELDVGCLKWAS